ncbi:hypothetical protein C8R46DRAFT_1113921 [Mycena filopes]|nr:hypothetical protein C8R46DRAFT_1113921 [Mycena filopes]
MTVAPRLLAALSWALRVAHERIETRRGMLRMATMTVRVPMGNPSTRRSNNRETRGGMSSTFAKDTRILRR